MEEKLQAENYKATLGIGIVLIVVALAQIVYSIISGGSFASTINGLIMPALYTWAVYQSEE